MVIGHIFSAINEELEFLYIIPLRGIDEISGFTDSITGETINRFFDKSFSFSIDGVKFSDFQTLIDSNISSISFDEYDDLLIKIRYKRAGNDSTGNLTLNSFRIDATYTVAGLQILSFKKDGFLKLFSIANKNFNESWINFLDKLYSYGIVPSFVKRGDTDYYEFDDTDYINFFKTSAYFYALLDFASEKNITDFFSYRDEFTDFLLQRNIFLSGNETINTLSVLRNKIYRNVAKRGTNDIFFEDGDLFNQVPDPIHGEMRRILGYEYPDFFAHDFSGKGLCGFYCDSFSPEYNNFNKTKGFNSFVELTGDANINYEPDNNIVYDLDQNDIAFSNEFKVDSQLKFLIFFSVQKENANGRFTIDVIAKDYDGNVVDLQNYESPNSTNNNFVTSANLARASEFFTFFGLIQPLGETFAGTSSTNLGIGKNLRFSTEIQTLQIKITNSSTSSGKIYVKNIFFNPILNTLSKTYSNSSPILTILMSSNKSLYSNEELLKRDIRRFLIPYSCFINLFFARNERVYSENELYGWLLPDGGYWLTPDGEPWLLPN